MIEVRIWATLVLYTMFASGHLRESKRVSDAS
jgi:hypothetical protein